MGFFDFSIIRTLRKKWGITAEELAAQAGITRATVAKKLRKISMTQRVKILYRHTTHVLEKDQFLMIHHDLT